MSFQKKQVQLQQLNISYLDEGNGPAILFLHGFPDSSELWRNQIPFFVEAGFRVIAPDQRGFGDSDKPQEKEAYQLPKLANDVIQLLDSLQIEHTHIVAHDWGSAVGWVVASLYPNRVESFVPISVGHPSVFTDFTLEQFQKSWYILLFQFQGIAEQMLQKNDWALFKEWSLHHPEHSRWIENMKKPGALTAGLNWYRANLAPEALPAMPLQIPSVRVPTLGIWSSGDHLLTEEQMIRSGEKVIGKWRYEKFKVSHWVPLDAPDQLNDVIFNFIKNG